MLPHNFDQTYNKESLNSCLKTYAANMTILALVTWKSTENINSPNILTIYEI